jgi:hypothetical protein
MKTVGRYQAALLAHVAALSESESMAIYEQLAGQGTGNSRSLEPAYGKSRFDSYSRSDAANEAAISGNKLQEGTQDVNQIIAAKRAARAQRIAANGINSLR